MPTFHTGLAGENGGIAFFLNLELDPGGLSGRFLADSNRFILDATEKDLLAARSYYVNLHTTGFGSGELRGQIVGQPLATFRSFLAGAQEVPSVISGGEGELVIELQDGSIIASGTFQGLGSAFNTNIGAHLHEGLAGTNGPVAIPLSPTLDGDNLGGGFEADNNTFPLPNAQLTAMLDRAIYVNIHTVGNPTGELRGQVVPEGNYFLYSLFSATQEVTPQVSPAFGAGVMEVRGDQGVFTGSFDQLENGFNEAIAGGAHLHAGFAGQNGPVVFLLNSDLNPAETSGVFDADSNIFALTATLRDTIRSRFLYVNIHSDSIVPGEIRGQVLGEAQNYFLAPLSGASELVPVNSDGQGTLALEWLSGSAIASGALSGLSGAVDTDILGGAHIHRGLAGQNGGVELILTPELSGDSLSAVFQASANRWDLSAGQTDTLISRGYYVNVHSKAHPSGELRGQILPPANAYFTTTLAGKNETTPNNSTGVGALKLELVRDQLIVSGALSGMQGDFDVNIVGGAHLHSGQVGTNGGIELLLNSELNGPLTSATFEADSNVLALSADQLLLLLEDGLYANIHSTLFPSGELRGQILAETNAFPSDAPAITAPASGASVSIEGDSTSAFTATWSPTTDPDGNPLAYLWELAAVADFSSQILYLNVGDSPEFTTDFATVDSILAANGVAIGDSITLYHRATATDGAVCQVGAADSVVLTRTGLATSVSWVGGATIQVYPNPGRDQLTVALTDMPGQSVTLELANAVGQTVYRSQSNLKQGSLQTVVNVSQLPAGMYTLRLTGNSYAHTYKWIKQ